MPLPDLVEAVDTMTLAASMAKVDRTHARLQRCRDSEWAVPAGHPDIDPRQEALLLREALYESCRHLDDAYDTRFKTWLSEAHRSARAIEDALLADDSKTASSGFDILTGSCVRCHQAYRD